MLFTVFNEDKDEAIREAARALQKGMVVVCPTDTVYGLLADARNKKAARRIFVVKGREQGKALPIFVSGMAQAKRLAKISKAQEKKARAAWPGRVTLVFESKGTLPKETGTTKKIGLRIPAHPVVLAIMKKTRAPLVGTSANVSGLPSCRSSAEVLAQFAGRKNVPDIVLDAGLLPLRRPSKIIDITGKKPVVLRK